MDHSLLQREYFASPRFCADAVFSVAWNHASPSTVATGAADDVAFLFQVSDIGLFLVLPCSSWNALADGTQ